ncbi:hypothetical protein CSW77_26485, partial [Shigella flexneri]
MRDRCLARWCHVQWAAVPPAGDRLDEHPSPLMLLPAGCAVLGAIIALSLLKLLNPSRSSHEARL